LGIKPWLTFPSFAFLIEYLKDVAKSTEFIFQKSGVPINGTPLLMIILFDRRHGRSRDTVRCSWHHPGSRYI
jgi:hypothetical protein